MRFDIITLFPELFSSFLAESLLAKAIAAGIMEVHLRSPRDFAPDRHRTADDRPYGGGPGMVLKPEPLAAAIEAAGRGKVKPWKIFLSPSGRPLTQSLVRRLAARPRLMLICGRYEGIDQRVVDLFADEEISIGDYVVNGGEVPAMVLMEAVGRLLPGFMGKDLSAAEESHESGLLEYPHYTRPPVFRGLKVPPVLFCGDHQKVARWRLRAALERSLELRPDLLARAELSPEALKLLNEPPEPEPEPRKAQGGAQTSGGRRASKNAAPETELKKAQSKAQTSGGRRASENAAPETELNKVQSKAQTSGGRRASENAAPETELNKAQSKAQTSGGRRASKNAAPEMELKKAQSKAQTSGGQRTGKNSPPELGEDGGSSAFSNKKALKKAST